MLWSTDVRMYGMEWAMYAGAVAWKRASLVVVRAEGKTEPGPAGRGNASSPPTTPAGMSGSEAPLSVVTQSAPLEQGSAVPVSERMAYVCQDCGYVYDQETPFEDVSEDYNCPRNYSPLHSIPKFHEPSMHEQQLLHFACRFTSEAGTFR